MEFRNAPAAEHDGNAGAKPKIMLDPHFRNIGRIVVNDLEAILAGHVPQEMQPAQPESIRNQGSRARSTSERYVWNPTRMTKKDT